MAAKRKSQDEVPGKPRRMPRTLQGKQIVDSVLIAAERVVAAGGSVGAIRMNDLAREAGVSVGSVYHYFPNRQAIVAELARRLESRGMELATEAIVTVRHQNTLDALRVIVRLLHSRRLGDPVMRRSLLRDVPPSWIEDHVRQIDNGVHAMLVQWLSERRSELRPADLELQVFIASHAVEAVVERAQLYRPELLESEAFWDELAELAWRFLRADSERAREPS
ncbi:MAG: TetR/AcrR family transcriptional regulator [Polyangiaceae bacterium]|nr:TetR/AcrR family transcriptional regulator [Myxococcales bacterium]MCB9586474.1 TetR/AcrR family transcriptional regulator [Polyangiaceae bacterium]MCB9605981.1 TetR/AcrR family transcriptional regulator [Polyangiaceae bacterium]